MVHNRIIAISRQYGSGGRQIGECLAKRLNIPFYDKQILALAAEQSGVVGDFFVQPEQENYHLCIDSGYLGIDGAVTMIETAYLLKMKAE